MRDGRRNRKRKSKKEGWTEREREIEEIQRRRWKEGWKDE
jgi:hypothetical protein